MPLGKNRSSNKPRPFKGKARLVKFTPAFLALCLGCAITTVSQARENPYDLFGKTITPFLNLVASESQNPNRALTAELTLARPAGSKEMKNGDLHLAMEYPDKLRLRSAALGEELTVCRSGQEIWVTPGSVAEALIKTAGPLSKAQKKYRLGNFELPFPEQQLVFLPALFSISEAEDEVVEGAPCRVLEVTLMSQIAEAMGIEAWSARIWIREDHTPAKLQIANGQMRYSALVRSVKFTRTLPPETWLASGDDVLRLTPGRYKQLLDQVLARVNL